MSNQVSFIFRLRSIRFHEYINVIMISFFVNKLSNVKIYFDLNHSPDYKLIIHYFFFFLSILFYFLFFLGLLKAHNLAETNISIDSNATFVDSYQKAIKNMSVKLYILIFASIIFFAVTLFSYQLVDLIK